MPLQSRPYLPAPLNLNHPLARGLVAWWLCVPGLSGGPKWWELVGGNHGTLINMTASTVGWQASTRPGAVGGQMAFNGSNSFLSIPQATSLQPPSVTVACWIYSTSSSGQQPYRAVDNASSGNYGFTFSLYGVTSGKLSFFIKANTADNHVEGTLGQNAWHHAIGTYDGTTQAIYIDGLLGASQSLSGAITYGTGNTLIGTIASNSPSQTLSGAIDDVRVYNRAISAAEAFDLYSNSRRGYSGLLNQTKVTYLSFGNTYNQVMSGGVLGGTLATVQTIYSNAITSAGVWSAGSVTSTATYNASLPSSGVLDTGNAPSAATYNLSLAPAGVLASGIGSALDTGNIVASGGLYAASAATVSTVHNLDPLASAGLLAGGAGNYAATFAPTITATGAGLAGSALVAASYGAPPVSAGVWPAGSAMSAATYDLDSLTTAGILDGGTSPGTSAFNPSLTPAGVMTAGSAISIEDDNAVIAAAGGLLSGSAPVAISYGLAPVSAGVWIAGSATNNASYDLDPLTPAGILTGGLSPNTSGLNLSLTPAGIVAAGSVSSIEDDNPVITAAGLLAGGSAIVGIQPLVSGEASLSGSVLTSCRYNPTVAGGIVADGHAVRLYDVTATGGAVVGTAADAGFQYDAETAGGLLAADAEAGVIYKPAFRVYHKFKIGEVVFAPTAFPDRYLQYKVLALATFNTQVAYQVGVGWFQEEELMSCEEYRVWRCEKAKLIRRFLQCPVR